MGKKKIEVEEISIDGLTPDDRNANRHTEKGDALLTKSIGELGLGRSVLVDTKGKLIAGNGVQRQALAAGKTKALVVDVDGDTLLVARRNDLDLDDPNDPRGRQMALIDNSSALAGINFDFEIAEEIGGDFGFDVADWGIEIPEETKAPEADDDNFNAPPPKEPITVLGDLYELHSTEAGLKHRVQCGSSADSDLVANLMDGKKADLYITDPPYGVAYVGKTKDALTIENDAMNAEETHQLWRDVFNTTLLFLKDGGPIYATVPAGLLQVGFMQVMLDADCLRQCMVWNKGQMVLGHSDYHYQHEPVLYGWKPGAAHYFTDDRTKTTVFDVKKPTRNTEHPTMKPIELWAEFIANSSRQGAIVYDTFLGSGTTLIASEQLNRNCYGQELDPVYTDVIVRRWVKYMRDNNKKHIVYRNGEQLPEEEIDRYFKED